jgi:hypothetical protein
LISGWRYPLIAGPNSLAGGLKTAGQRTLAVCRSRRQTYRPTSSWKPRATRLNGETTPANAELTPANGKLTPADAEFTANEAGITPQRITKGANDGSLTPFAHSGAGALTLLTSHIIKNRRL